MQTTDTFIIVGGGIGGLATAVALQKNGFACQIYERDLAFESRRQGYSLTIQKNGFAALEKLGISEHVQNMSAGSAIFATSTYNNLGELIFSKLKKLQNTQRFNNFAIARQSLRACLINELKPDTIHWNKEMIRYESIPDDVHHIRVIFSDNTSIIGRALIGCDGVRSCMRKQMLGDSLNYLGVWAINGISSHQDNTFFKNQTIQILDGNSRLFIKPYSIDKSMWQLTFKVSTNDELSHRLQQSDLEGLLNHAKYLMKDWHESMKQLIHDTPLGEIRAGPLYDRDPLEKIDKNMACVTMLGDAVHPMSPFKGQGANQALVDAVTLVEYLVQHKEEDDEGVKKALTEFESEMLNRSKRYVLRSRFAVEFLHTDKALTSENMSQFVNGKILSE